MKKIHNSAEMWPVYRYGDHPKGTATIGEMAGALMHGNPKTKVMRLNNAIKTSNVVAPKPVAIVGGRVGGLSFVYNVADMVKWRKQHVENQTTKRENVMNRAMHKADLSKRRSRRAQAISKEASGAKLRYKKYVKMRQQAEKINVRAIGSVER